MVCAAGGSDAGSAQPALLPVLPGGYPPAMPPEGYPPAMPPGGDPPTELMTALQALQKAKRQGAGTTQPQPQPNWTRGEIFFEETRKRCFYLVAPDTDDDLTAADLMEKLLDPAWLGLRPPEMTITAQSLEGNYLEVTEICEKLKKARADARAGTMPAGEQQRQEGREDDGDPWWSSDNDELFKTRYGQQLSHLMGAICATSVECGAWLFGSGVRAGGLASGAVFEAGVQQYTRDKPTEADGLIFLGVQGPCQPNFWRTLEQEGLELPEGGAPCSCFLDPVTLEGVSLRDETLVGYPDIGELWKQAVMNKRNEEDDRDRKKLNLTVGGFCLNPFCTHYLFCGDKLREALTNLLEQVLPSVHVVVGGKNAFAVGHAVEKAARGATVLLLRNSGLWVNVLERSVAAALRQRKGARRAHVCKGTGPEEGSLVPNELPNGKEVATCADALAQCRLPAGVDPEKFWVFDLLSSTAPEVTRQLTMTLTAIRGDDQQAVGFARSEEERVRAALAMHLRYSRTARTHLCWGRFLHYSIVLVAVLTTLCVALLGNDDCRDGAMLREEPGLAESCSGKGAYGFLAVSCAVLPLISTFLHGANSVLASARKFQMLTAASERVISAIYLYRARVGLFQSSRQFHDTCRKWAQGRPAAWVPPAEGAREGPGVGVGGNQVDGASSLGCPGPPPDQRGLGRLGSSQSQCGHGDLGAPPDRRTSPQRAADDQASPSDRLIAMLSSIEDQVMAGGVQIDKLEEPPEDFWDDAKGKGLGHFATSSGNGCSCACCCRRRRSREVATVDVDPSNAGLGLKDTSEELLNLEDQACSLLSAEEYIAFRLLPLIEEFQKQVMPLEKSLRLSQMASLLGKPVAVLLGLSRLQDYIPVVVASISSVDSVAHYEQWQLRITYINQSLTRLRRLDRWWNMLTLVEQRKWNNKDFLITEAESVACVTAALYHNGLQMQDSPRQSLLRLRDEYGGEK